jgi:TPP-dependent pyruvate/acetoin dehydrogenase alpha subunit
VKKLLIDNFVTAEEIKSIEKDIRNSVQESLIAAKKGAFAPDDWMYREIHATPEMKDESIKFIRMPDLQKSIHN